MGADVDAFEPVGFRRVAAESRVGAYPCAVEGVGVDRIDAVADDAGRVVRVVLVLDDGLGGLVVAENAVAGRADPYIALFVGFEVGNVAVVRRHEVVDDHGREAQARDFARSAALGADEADAAADIDDDLAVVVLLDVVDVFEREVLIARIDPAERRAVFVEVDHAVVRADPHDAAAVGEYAFYVVVGQQAVLGREMAFQPHVGRIAHQAVVRADPYFAGQDGDVGDRLPCGVSFGIGVVDVMHVDGPAVAVAAGHAVVGAEPDQPVVVLEKTAYDLRGQRDGIGDGVGEVRETARRDVEDRKAARRRREDVLRVVARHVPHVVACDAAVRGVVMALPAGFGVEYAQPSGRGDVERMGILLLDVQSRYQAVALCGGFFQRYGLEDAAFRLAAVKPVEGADPEPSRRILAEAPDLVVHLVAVVVVELVEVYQAVPAVEPDQSVERADPEIALRVFAETAYAQVAQQVAGVVFRRYPFEVFLLRVVDVYALLRADEQPAVPCDVETVDPRCRERTGISRFVSVNVEFGAVVPVQPLRRTDPDESLRILDDGVDHLVRESLLDADAFEVELQHVVGAARPGERAEEQEQ